MRTLLLAAAALAACALTPPPAMTAPPFAPLAYPPTRAEPVSDLIHGVQVADPYRWLEDERSPEVQAWMKAQDGLARATLEGLPARAAVRARLRELLYVESMGVPEKRGSLLFYLRRGAEQEKAVLVVKDGAGAERTLLDPNAWTRDGSLSLGTWNVSWDGRTLVYQERPNASDEATLRVVDVASGKLSAVDVVPGAKVASPSFTAAGDGFVYTWYPNDPAIPEAERSGHQEVRFHRLGSDPRTDTVVQPASGDPRSFLGASFSRDGRWLFVVRQHGWSATDVWFRDLRHGLTGPLTPLAVGQKAIYAPDAHRGAFYVRTNEGAPRYRLFRVDPARPERQAWEEIVPEGPGTLEGVAVVGGRLALQVLVRAAHRLEIRGLDGRLQREVALPTLGTVSLPSGEEDADQAYFSFESFTVPPEVHELSVAAGTARLLFRPRLPIDPGRFTVEQVEVPSKDGTRVTMFLVRGREVKPDGQVPVRLNGYGGFNVSVTPAFAAGLYPWLERGALVALPNLRGGGEYGEAWHEAGMLHRKQNVFDDFAAAAEWLQRSGWSRPGRIAIRGGSNGGLLVGALLTQRPELFGVGLCHVPLLDMVRYHRFGLGQAWVPEYGSADDPAQFRTLHAYSPYHRLVPGTAYPPLLLLSADHDDRVDPMHARKFAAAMQAATRGGPVLLRIEKNSGHQGADMRRAAADQEADATAFAFQALGVRDR
ncbi:MAG: S9 family peptidase [Deltaproteobacteria bacterium]|nr:S9 family peptidase [Deltaproteobacteria bacterium]